MGKGGGCVPSKKKKPSSLTTTTGDGPGIDDNNATGNAPIQIDDDRTTATNTAGTTTPAITTTSSAAAAAKISSPLKIFVVFYSMYGHVESLAKRMKKGVDSVEGVEATLYRVPETLSQEVVDQMKAPAKDFEIPEITAAELAAADGFLFGFPTRYGCMAAQMKAFFDSTGSLWKEQSLAGKPAGFFVSTGTQGGGQETTAWTAITQLVHHGMLFVPIGYTFGAGMFKMDSIRGGSPYGAGVFAGDGSREATETELALAEHQGNYMAAIVKRLAQP
ncbi:PREDICTED: probable NAD(P)H dehydrogenase (quinone) FQR1-like 2 [Camelina sativa]|uniref:NAD(P)H dehydrogenase (quinone) n=1 Tax=Camelina sativa TaxID=90675 RepID=A0ABM0TVN2_CAMSA|nr:PREDICTED: probable NAD(P)H dehydrogenase (quinone) FQR1-like 2 [Camelina sativa]